jgi:hypothetical protein
MTLALCIKLSYALILGKRMLSLSSLGWVPFLGLTPSEQNMRFSDLSVRLV